MCLKQEMQRAKFCIYFFAGLNSLNDEYPSVAQHRFSPAEKAPLIEQNDNAAEMRKRRVLFAFDQEAFTCIPDPSVVINRVLACPRKWHNKLLGVFADRAYEMKSSEAINQPELRCSRGGVARNIGG